MCGVAFDSHVTPVSVPAQHDAPVYHVSRLPVLLLCQTASTTSLLVNPGEGIARDVSVLMYSFQEVALSVASADNANG